MIRINNHPFFFSCKGTSISRFRHSALGFPGGSDGKASACNAEDLGLIPGLGRSPGGGKGNPLQCFCLENPMDGGAWRHAGLHFTLDHSAPRLSDLNFLFSQQLLHFPQLRLPSPLLLWAFLSEISLGLLCCSSSSTY